MQIVEHFMNSPEETVAMDELLLRRAESGGIGETLRFWEVNEYFIVTGRGCRVDKDCCGERCRRDGIRIIRRISGGGTVLQGPGCLNYSLILSYQRDAGYKDVRNSYSRILKGISDSFKTKGCNVEFFPVSDLALGGKKISGNAQARKKIYFLHHGTFLFDFDLEKISAYLKHPSKEPEYRKMRCHEDFLVNVPFSSDGLQKLVTETFPPSGGIWKPSQEDLRELEKLTAEKYLSDEWNYAL